LSDLYAPYILAKIATNLTPGNPREKNKKKKEVRKREDGRGISVRLRARDKRF